MRIALILIVSAMSACSKPPSPSSPATASVERPALKGATKLLDTQFVYIKIPESLMPLDRGSKYEDPLQASLAELQLGEITGGGSQLGDKREDGTRPIAFCGIDVELTVLDGGRELLRKRLVELGAPIGTELHYTRGETKLLDQFRTTGWVLDQPRAELHPGFGI